MTFSRRLEKLISDHDTSAAAVGRAVGTSHVSIGNYLEGRVPRWDIAKKIADHFKVSVEWLLEGEGDAEGGVKEEAVEYKAPLVSHIDWKERALAAEEKLASLKEQLQRLLKGL